MADLRMPKKKVSKVCDVSRIRVAHMSKVVKRMYMRILRLSVLPRIHVRTTQLTLCINDTFAQYVKMLLRLLVQTETWPRMYLVFLQRCVDGDSTKLLCNALSTLKSSQPGKSHHVTNNSAISHCRHHPVSLDMLLVALSPAPSIVAFHIPIEKLGYCHLSHSPYRRAQH
jgi:hypothetical protein